MLNKFVNPRLHRRFVFAGLIAGLLQSGCTSLPNAPYIEPPDLMDQLANADLSAPQVPVADDRGVEYGSGNWRNQQYERYPGDENSIPKRPRFKGVSGDDDGYELNFDNVDLSQVAKVILKDTLNISYVFDPNVRGKVTLATGRPISRSQLIFVLENILAMNQASLVMDGAVYQVVPEKIAGDAVSVPIDYDDERKQIGPGYGITVFPISFISSRSLLESLRTFVKKPDVLRADVYNNLLIIRGTGRARQQLIEVASMFDVDWMRGRSAGIFTLANTVPSELIEELEKVFETDDRGKDIVQFQPVERMNAVLVIARKSHALEDAELWIKRLDRVTSEGSNYYVYRVEHGKAKDIAFLLNQMFAEGGGVSGPQIVRSPEEEVAPDQSASNFIRKAETANGEKSKPATDQSAAARSKTATESSQVADTGSVRIVADEINNKLLIQASGRDYRRILGMLQSIDRPALQVLINATLAEVTLNDNLSYGVQVFLQANNKKDTFGFSNGQSIEIGPNLPGLNFMFGSFVQPKVILDALSQETNVKVVSSPSVVVVNNETATLTVGDEVPIISRQVQGVTDPLAPTVNEIQYRDTGVILKVTPQINTNGKVTMEIEQEISVVAGTTAGVQVLDNLTPTISQRRIVSTVAVQNGQMVVLAGLINEQGQIRQNSVPLLNQIPYLGDVIGSNNRDKRRTELIIFLRPSVIRSPEDARSVSEEMRARLEALAPRPSPWDMNVSGPDGAAVQVK